MNWIVYLFGSGLVFFLGVGIVLAGVAFAWISKPSWLARSASVLGIVGLLLVALSAAPLSYWFYAAAFGITLLWLIAERAKSPRLMLRRKLLSIAVIALWLVGVAMELPYQCTPGFVVKDRPVLYVIADSVSAGMGDQAIETWPRQLERTRGIEVHDCSRPGATVASALKQADALPPTGGIVLLEIGGNDVLGPTSVSEFEQGLERLLSKVCVPGRTVLMFELPLPPFHNDYGRVQRRLAAQHGVYLIPKRVFAEILAGKGRTLDTIHLSESGHKYMAEVIGALIQPKSFE